MVIVQIERTLPGSAPGLERKSGTRGCGAGSMIVGGADASAIGAAGVGALSTVGRSGSIGAIGSVPPITSTGRSGPSGAVPPGPRR